LPERRRQVNTQPSRLAEGRPCEPPATPRVTYLRIGPRVVRAVSRAWCGPRRSLQQPASCAALGAGRRL